VPQITHRDLVAFAGDKVNLKKTEVDDQRAQVNRLRDRIESKIAASPGYGFVKALHAGSVAKGTALRSVNDRDLAVYVKAEKAPDETPELVNWVRDRVVEAYPAMREDQIVASTNCVNVRFAGTGLDVDVVPVLYEGEPNGSNCDCRSCVLTARCRVSRAATGRVTGRMPQVASRSRGPSSGGSRHD